jgi:hypothetical protein
VISCTSSATPSTARSMGARVFSDLVTRSWLGDAHQQAIQLARVLELVERAVVE